MTDHAPRTLGRRTLASSAAVLAAAGAMSAIRAENDVASASAATGPVPASTVPSARSGAWTVTPLATAASAGHPKHKKHKKKVVKHKKKVVKPKAKAKPKATPTPTPAPTPTPTPTTPTTPSTPVA